MVDKENLMNSLFTVTEQITKDETKELEIKSLNTFHTGEYEHIFSVEEDADMLSLIDDIKDNGVLEPILVRPDGEDEYEIIAGHRRIYASKKLGLDRIKAVILDYDDDTAIKVMILTNLKKRSEIKPSEKAFAYKTYMQANKRQGIRTDLKKDMGGASKELSEKYFENERTIRKYIRLTRLTGKLLDMVDNKLIDFTTAVNLTFLDNKTQEAVYEEFKQGSPLNSDISKEIKTGFTEGSINKREDIKEIIGVHEKILLGKKYDNRLNSVIPKKIIKVEEKIDYIRKAIENYESSKEIQEINI